MLSRNSLFDRPNHQQRPLLLALASHDCKANAKEWGFSAAC
jgi:hypothetical protein